MAGKPRFDREEVEIRVSTRRRDERPRTLIAWWMRLEHRMLLARKQQPRPTHRARGAGRPQPYAQQRRSVVKAMYTRNGRPKAGAWGAHARYLTREGAQLESQKGLGFDAGRDDLDMVATVTSWEKAGDELMWRIIVSPEDGDRLDLKDHVRELVGAMEHDLGTRLEWVAIDHNNTDSPHVHLLVRGIDERGKSLVIDREYIRSGIRARSQEIASRQLGQRLEPEVLQARGKTIDKERWTEIDRALQRRARADRIVDYGGFIARSDGSRIRVEQEMQRLQFLEGLGLARRLDSHSWELSPDHEPQLRARQQAMDIIKRQAQASRVRSLDELGDERDVVRANPVTHSGYEGRFVGYFQNVNGERYAGLQRGHTVTAVPTDRNDLNVGGQYDARPSGKDWQLTEGRRRGRERS